MADFNAWNGNPLETRKDVEDALMSLVDPLVPAFTKGYARVYLAETGAAFGNDGAGIEGFTRPLWGIVPFVAGGGDFKYWDTFRSGIISGTDPNHAEYWGEPTDFDQRLVEMASLGFALCFVPEIIWTPLPSSAKKNFTDYLLITREKEYCNTNWKFFRILIDLGLHNVGVSVDSESTEQMLDDIEKMYLKDGWYGDGKSHRIDYYNAFAFHFYSLIYVIVKGDQDKKRKDVYLERAILFAQEFIHWSSPDGSLLPYGRSLTYRFAVISFWGILPCALDKSRNYPLSWGTMKGIYFRHLKWWKKQPITTFKSNILTVGYSYPNLFLSERYNSPQSPYWALKAFAPLFLSESHPFWTSTIEPLQLNDAYLKTIGMIITHNETNTQALVSGPWSDEYQNEKYTKFAYSTKYGFGVVSNHRTFKLANFDNMIGFSFNNKEFYVREKHSAWIFDDGLYSVWSPVSGIHVSTWLFQRNGYHLRIHKIENNTDMEVFTIEGGFNVPQSKQSEKETQSNANSTYAKVTSEDDVSLIQDLEGHREPLIIQPEPNTNLLYPNVYLPQLRASISPRTNVKFGCIVACNSVSSKDINITEEKLPDDKELEAIKNSSSRVLCNI